MVYKNKKRIFITLLAMMCLFMSAAPSAMALQKATLTSNTTLREEADAKSKGIAKLKKGDEVALLSEEETNGFVNVLAQDIEGYVEAKGLSYITKEAYAVRNTQMYAEKGARGGPVQTIAIKEKVYVLDDEDKTWWKVQYEGKTGYCQSIAIKLGTPPEEEQNPQANTALSALDPNASKIAKAKAINKDTVGWMDIPNTNIDDPMLYAPNFYYSNYNIYKKKSLEGIYPYVNMLTRNVVLFGHNLRGSNSGTHQLHHLQEAAIGYKSCQYSGCRKSISSLSNWYKSESGRVFNISIFGKTKWEVFAMYEVPRNEPITTLRSNWSTYPSNLGGWIEKQIKRSEVDFGVSVSDKDQIMTIITCGTNYDSATANSRLFFFLKCVG